MERAAAGCLLMVVESLPRCFALCAMGGTDEEIREDVQCLIGDARVAMKGCTRFEVLDSDVAYMETVICFRYLPVPLSWLYYSACGKTPVSRSEERLNIDR